MISSKPFFMFLAERNISQKDFCRKTGITLAKIRKLREGQISPQTIDEICKVLKINIEDVLEYKED